jgi:uncharacterized protein
MTDPKSANDPSMDDILASIRKIISDDEARAQVNSQQAAAQSGGRPAVTPPRIGPEGESKLHAAGRDDVLLLTDLIEEPKSGTVPPPIPLPRIDPVRAAEMPQPSIEPARSDSTLVGGGAATTTASAFSRLNQAVQDSVPPPAAADPGPVVASGKTVEELVKETLRPMLKEWLDQNLPQVVERYVEREIVRLTRR